MIRPCLEGESSDELSLVGVAVMEEVGGGVAGASGGGGVTDCTSGSSSSLSPFSDLAASVLAACCCWCCCCCLAAAAIWLAMAGRPPRGALRMLGEDAEVVMRPGGAPAELIKPPIDA